MIVSISMFRWNDGAIADRVATMAAALDGLVAKFPQLAEYRHGSDLGLREGNADYAIVAGARTVEDLQSYLEDPEHQQIVRDLLAPLVASRQSLQFEIPDS